MEQYECKRLDLDALHLVYREHLTPDFPPAERKPLSAMEKLLSAGRYEPWGLYRGEELMAYALLWRDPEGGFVLLDYLGVCRDKPKGQGIGTVMVAHLMGQYRHVSGILVEAEAEGDDASPEENGLRARRLAFYRRLGFRELGYVARIFGVRYAMLLYGDRTGEEAMEAHQRLYHYEFSPWLYDRFIHIPERS
ncbi:GNAT family N-acetyltransferase [Intestinimonas butyriciproducens]|uniref:GNAT family N-acetyltransferase n=1 Tax=Intestinimonas butyriciproducens TaxID=1297617 RepID=UPI001FAB8C63|nr:GNAT family N-acetyltransferase [Intestinimonas butyriciproducens]